MREECLELTSLKDVVLICFANEGIGLVGSLVSLDPENDHTNPHVLRRGNTFPKIFISSKQIGSRDSPLTG